MRSTSTFFFFDADGSGSIGVEEIKAIEEKFGLPLTISAGSEQWADGKIDLAEFTKMLEANGNIKAAEAEAEGEPAPESEAAAEVAEGAAEAAE